MKLNKMEYDYYKDQLDSAYLEAFKLERELSKPKLQRIMESVHCLKQAFEEEVLNVNCYPNIAKFLDIEICIHPEPIVDREKALENLVKNFHIANKKKIIK